MHPWIASLLSLAAVVTAERCQCLHANVTTAMSPGQNLSIGLNYGRPPGACVCQWRLFAECSSCYLYVDFSRFRLLPKDTLRMFDVDGNLLQECSGSDELCARQETSSGSLRLIFASDGTGKAPDGPLGISARVGVTAIKCPIPYSYMLAGGALLLLLLVAVPVLLCLRRRSLLSAAASVERLVEEEESGKQRF